MSERSGASWVVYALATLLAGAIVAAILVVGPASGQQAAQTRTITAQRGVVQSTVSGSGNIEPASQLNLGFKTSGTVTRIAVTQGAQVAQGQLLATLDPQSAEVTLEQARASLQAAEADLAREEETDGETSSSSGQGSSGARAEAATGHAGPSTDEQAGGASGSAGSSGSSTGAASSGSSASSPEISSATREANIASARAAVKSDRLAVESAEEGVTDTRLLAPESGTIVSLEGEVGETVSGDGTSRASAKASGSSSDSGTSDSGASGSGASGSATGSGSSNSSSGAFAVLSDLSSMRLVVPLSESEVGGVKRGQTATVTVEALEGVKLAAHVSEVASLPTSNSGVVSYDVTFQLDQLTAGLKAGMSATAEVIVKQAAGVNVPSSAITGGAVTVIEGDKQVRRAITTGLAGDSTTIVLSGLRAGERIALPLASSSAASVLSQLGGRARSSGLGGGFSRGGGGFGGLGRVGGGAGPGG